MWVLGPGMRQLCAGYRLNENRRHAKAGIVRAFVVVLHTGGFKSLARLDCPKRIDLSRINVIRVPVNTKQVLR